MNLITRVLVFVFLVLGSSINAQYKLDKKSNVKVSSPYPVFDGRKFYFSNDDEIHTLKLNAKKEVLHQVFNEDVKLISSDKISNAIENGSVHSLVKTTKGDFIYSYEKTKSKVDFYVSDVNIVEKNPVGSQVKVNSIALEKDDLFEFNKLTESDDRSKVMSFTTIHKPKADQKDELNIAVYNEEMEQLWAAQFPMPYTSFNSEILDQYIDNSGNVYVLMKYFYSKDEREYPRKYVIQIMRIDGEQYSIQTVQPKDEGIKYNVDFGYTDMNNGTLLTSMFYSYGKDELAKKKVGLMLMYMNEDGEFEEEKIIKIPEEIVQYNIPEKELNAVKYSMWHRSSHYDDEGNLTIVAGLSPYRTSTHIGQKEIKSSIVILQLDKSGNLNWIKNVDKEDIPYLTTNAKYFYTNNKLYLMCGSNTSDSASRERGILISLYTVDLNQGLITKNEFFDYSKVKGIPIYQFNFNRIQQIDDGVFTLECYKKKKEDVLIRFSAD